MNITNSCVRQLCQGGRVRLRESCRHTNNLNQSGNSFVHRLKNDIIIKRFYCEKPTGPARPAGVGRQGGGGGAKQIRRSPITWKSLAFTFGVGGLMTYGVIRAKNKKQLKIEKERTKSLGKALIGGPWELVNTDGKLVKSSDFHGQWVLLYFGFTHCPDVCPDELEKMVKAVDFIDDEKSMPNLTPIFITVDPQRDTPKVITEYLEEFSTKIVGLTGSDDQIQGATRAYRVYFSPGPKDVDNDYIVDHTIIMYLVNPDGDFVNYYGQDKTHIELRSSIQMHMMKYNAIKKQNI